MNQQSFTMVPTEFLERIEQRLGEIQQRLDAATVEPAPKWLPIKTAAEKLGKNPSTIHRWIDSGKIKAKGSGTMRRVLVEQP